MVRPAGTRKTWLPALRIEHAVMAGAGGALVLLVVLPLAFLLWGSVSAEGRPTLEHFREALSSRLYVHALKNSLILGTWTGVLSVLIGLPLAWAVSRTTRRASGSSTSPRSFPTSRRRS
jgi:iron(III) transport system permease protein